MQRFFLLIEVLILASLAVTVRAAECGDTMTWIDNVPARHNGQYHGCINGCLNCAGEGTYGGQYQCVELVKRFHNQSEWSGDGGTYFSTAESKGLTAFGSGTSNMLPVHGDIICWDGTNHVALVDIVSSLGSGDYSVEVVEQNWDDDGRHTEILKTDEDGNLFFDDSDIQGWLRNPDYKQFACSWVDQSRNPLGPYFPGQLVSLQVRYGNIGSATWYNDAETHASNYVELASTDSAGTLTESFFNYPPDSPDPNVNWLNNIAPCSMQEESVAPGDTATFIFTGRINLNAKPGHHKIYFGPVHNGAVIPGWGEMHYAIDVVSGWVASVPANDCDGPVGGNFQWHQAEFNPRYNDWRPQVVPDAGWGCNNCDKYYRYWYSYSTNQSAPGVSVYFRSDDAITIYVNGHILGEWGAGCHRFGCINGPGPCDVNYQVPAVEITPLLREGANLISAHVTEREGGEYFSLVFNEHPMILTSDAICCLGADACETITQQYTSVNCQQDGGQLYIGGWFDCGTFSSCDNPQKKSKSDPVLYFTTSMPIPTLPAELTFQLDESKPRSAYYDLPEVLGGSRLNVADFTGQFTVLAEPSGHTDTVNLTVTSYQFDCPQVNLAGQSTGVNHVRLDTSLTAVRQGKFIRSTRVVDMIIQSILYNDIFTVDDPVQCRSQIRGHFNINTGILESGSEAYNVIPIDCIEIGCGDIDGNCSVNITDVVCLIGYIFGGTTCDPFHGGVVADVNCDTKVNIADCVHLVNFIFASGPVPCEACP